MQPFLLFPLVEQLISFGPFSVLAMLQHIYTFDGAIDEIDLKENAVKIMEAQLIGKLETGR